MQKLTFITRQLLLQNATVCIMLLPIARTALRLNYHALINIKNTTHKYDNIQPQIIAYETLKHTKTL